MTKHIRTKIWAITSLIFLAIVAMRWMSHYFITAIFTAFFILWAATFYLKKVRVKSELVTDGVWWIPYFLVIGLGILAFSEKYRIILTEQNWERSIQGAFLLIICAILFFWEWPPWLDRNKTLISKGKRILMAYLFFIFGLVIWVYGGMCIINVAWDNSRPAAHDFQVIEKAALGHNSAAEKQYIILIKPWGARWQSNSFLVSNQEYQRIIPDSTMVRVWTKEGFFHFEWVSGIRILTPAG